METILTVVFSSKAWHNWRNKRQRKKLKRLSRSRDRGFRSATKSQARSLKLCLISKNPVNMANHYKSLVRGSDHLLLIPVRLKEKKGFNYNELFLNLGNPSAFLQFTTLFSAAKSKRNSQMANTILTDNQSMRLQLQVISTIKSEQP